MQSTKAVLFVEAHVHITYSSMLYIVLCTACEILRKIYTLTEQSLQLGIALKYGVFKVTLWITF